MKPPTFSPLLLELSFSWADRGRVNDNTSSATKFHHFLEPFITGRDSFHLVE